MFVPNRPRQKYWPQTANLGPRSTDRRPQTSDHRPQSADHSRRSKPKAQPSNVSCSSDATTGPRTAGQLHGSVSNAAGPLRCRRSATRGTVIAIAITESIACPDGRRPRVRQKHVRVLTRQAERQEVCPVAWCWRDAASLGLVHDEPCNGHVHGESAAARMLERVVGCVAGSTMPGSEGPIAQRAVTARLRASTADEAYSHNGDVQEKPTSLNELTSLNAQPPYNPASD